MAARFCAKCGAPFRARGEVICGLCGEPRVRRDVEEAEPDLPPELEAQLAAARPITAETRRSPVVVGCLGMSVVGIVLALASSFCLRDINVSPPNLNPEPSTIVFTPAPFNPGGQGEQNP